MNGIFKKEGLVRLKADEGWRGRRMMWAKVWRFDIGGKFGENKFCSLKLGVHKE